MSRTIPHVSNPFCVKQSIRILTVCVVGLLNNFISPKIPVVGLCKFLKFPIVELDWLLLVGNVWCKRRLVAWWWAHITFKRSPLRFCGFKKNHSARRFWSAFCAALVQMVCHPFPYSSCATSSCRLLQEAGLPKRSLYTIGNSISLRFLAVTFFYFFKKTVPSGKNYLVYPVMKVLFRTALNTEFPKGSPFLRGKWMRLGKQNWIGKLSSNKSHFSIFLRL